MSEPFRVGLIGYGFTGSVFHAPLISTTTGLRLSAVVTAPDLGLRLELAGPSVKPGRGGNTVASLRHLSQALCRCRSAGGSTLVEGEV